jgi:hypothetical protein
MSSAIDCYRRIWLHLYSTSASSGIAPENAGMEMIHFITGMTYLIRKQVKPAIGG